jgi:hypothetical protein
MSLLADFALKINVYRKSYVLIITPKFLFAIGQETTQRRKKNSFLLQVGRPHSGRVSLSGLCVEKTKFQVMSLLADFALKINVYRKSYVLIITPKFLFAIGQETTQRRKKNSFLLQVGRPHSGRVSLSGLCVEKTKFQVMSLLADFALKINVSRKSFALIITPKLFFAAGRETTQRR